MGRGCGCCGTINGSCCPENVFEDENSGISLSALYKHEGPDETIYVEIETELSGRIILDSIDVRNGFFYYLHYIFAKELEVSLDEAPICRHYCRDSVMPDPITMSKTLDIYTFFDKDIDVHTLKLWIDEKKSVGSESYPSVFYPGHLLFCIKKYTGDPLYIYNNEFLLDNQECSQDILQDGVYYHSAIYNYIKEDKWSNSKKKSCICACTDIFLDFLPNYEIDENIEIQFDECGVIDSYSVDCNKVFVFTVTSKSEETGKEYTYTDRIEITGFGLVTHTVTFPDGEIFTFIQEVSPWALYIQPYARVLRPFSKTDVVTVSIYLSVSYIDCEGFLGCGSCPEGSREKCFCYKDSYSLSDNIFELRYSEPCLPVYNKTYTVNVIRNYRARNRSVNFSKFTLTVSNIYIDFDPLFWTAECKQIYKDFIKLALEGSYEFTLEKSQEFNNEFHECGSFRRIDGSPETVGQLVFPCSCINGGQPGFGGSTFEGELNLDLTKRAAGSVESCYGLAPMNDIFSDGVNYADMEGELSIVKRGKPTDFSGCRQVLPTFILDLTNQSIDLTFDSLAFSFVWQSVCEIISEQVNKKFSYCKGCGYVNRYIDMSPIKYRYSDLFPLSTSLDCDLEGVFS